MTSPRRQQQVPELETATLHMSISPRTTPVDWKLRYETLQFEHQLEIERVRLHYEHELKDKITEVRIQLKREYEHQFTEFRTRLHEQQQQQQQQYLLNLSSSSLGIDQNIGEKVREQVRLAQEYESFDDERRQILLQQSTDNDELKRLINKLHTEGVHVLTLSELLALRLNGINISTTEDSIRSLQKLNEENSFLRSLIGNMNANESSNKLIKCIADVFRCEQERRLIQIRQHPNFTQLEQEIHDMCNYQRDALAKFFSEDRLLLINELEQTKEQLNYLKLKFEQLKQTQNQTTSTKFYSKYLRYDNYRKALIYQKRYLLVLLTGYEDTETYALNEIRRLTGDTRHSSYPYNYDKMKLIRRPPFQRRLTDYRFRFRCYAQVVIAVFRMRWLVRKWVQKLAGFK
ncbi:unnamed protein product [Rotaria magnacalcarata]|uniref:Pericentrin/AKAP-450 centrosomal targeting domain-containing protein n=3 Tax=Rotaria magnacalcarata TaxID=392030 RepID=A0A816NKF9_9BILA|nr:unnamed protein product [Rotaria magnacalcarata]CAF1655309.1 unnamed protein product [Rotaria magnacalcarata]CAF1932005.1 unnamed protein product [Rotaria magnacalcarata]CAF2035627.1 unnamed protein product [Rotaria magnacalcarata]CAF4117060.1 unnamed protein product [Rotaria magnacalcarata]